MPFLLLHPNGRIAQVAVLVIGQLGPRRATTMPSAVLAAARFTNVRKYAVGVRVWCSQ